MAILSYLGVSCDRRTNRWAVICDCGKRFEPATTMFGSGVVTCPKCGQSWRCDYNAEPASIEKAD